MRQVQLALFVTTRTSGLNTTPCSYTSGGGLTRAICKRCVPDLKSSSCLDSHPHHLLLEYISTFLRRQFKRTSTTIVLQTSKSLAVSWILDWTVTDPKWQEAKAAVPGTWSCNSKWSVAICGSGVRHVELPSLRWSHSGATVTSLSARYIGAWPFKHLWTSAASLNVTLWGQ